MNKLIEECLKRGISIEFSSGKAYGDPEKLVVVLSKNGFHSTTTMDADVLEDAKVAEANVYVCVLDFISKMERRPEAFEGYTGDWKE